MYVGWETARQKGNKDMKKTNYTMLVSAGVASGTEKYRRVWQDENGNYFIKIDGEYRNVNHAQNNFIAD